MKVEECAMVVTTDETDPAMKTNKGRGREFFYSLRRRIQTTRGDKCVTKNGYSSDETVDETIFDDETSYSAISFHSIATSGSRITIASFPSIGVLGRMMPGIDEMKPSSLRSTASSYDDIFDTIIYDDSPTDDAIILCLDLLSRENDVDANRLGLQHLNMLTNKERSSNLTVSLGLGSKTEGSLYGSEEFALHVLVYGGPIGSVEEQLRTLFLSMICDDSDETASLFSNHTHSSNGTVGNNSNVLFSFESIVPKISEDEYQNKDNSDDESLGSNSIETSHLVESKDVKPGKYEGVLHNLALCILANALEKVSSMKTIPGSIPQRQPIPLNDKIWTDIICTIIDNIEIYHSYSEDQDGDEDNDNSNDNHCYEDIIEATGYSFKILRLLYLIQPNDILPLLRGSLFHRLVHLTENKERGGLHQRQYRQHSPATTVIHSDAFFLLRQAKKSDDLNGDSVNSCSNVIFRINNSKDSKIDESFDYI